MDNESAIKLSKSNWWERYSVKEVALAQLDEPLLCMPFAIFHQIVEKAINRPVQTYEFINASALITEINGPSPYLTLRGLLTK